jgi:hypothetical protein
MRGCRWWALLVAVAACAAVSARAGAGTGLVVGVDDDSLKWAVTPAQLLAIDKDVGFGAVRITLQWQPGLSALDDVNTLYVSRAQQAAKLGERVVLAVYGPAATPPTTTSSRSDFCSFVVSALGSARNIYDVVIWNEANSASFWLPQQGAAASYEALLETCYDAIHTARKNVNVITSLAPHEAPAKFIQDMATAYKADGRTAPIFDTFGIDAYPEASDESPFALHPGTLSLDQGDYVQLMAVLNAAFSGTGQPIPGSGVTTPGSVPPGGLTAAQLQPLPVTARRRNPPPPVVVPDGAVTIWYLEDGFETIVPPSKRRYYTGHETNTRLVPALLYGKATAGYTSDQSSQLRDALELAYCQPAVGAFFNFGLIDEANLSGWQSGLLWADGTPKPSYKIVKEAVTAVSLGAVDCSKLPSSATGLTPTVTSTALQSGG